MRITAKIATAGAAGLSRFLVPNATIDECCGQDGHLVEGKVRDALKLDQVQIASKDSMPVLAFALEYLTQTRSVVERLAAKLNEQGECASIVDERGFRTTAQTAGDKRCERQMKKNRVAYCRTDITLCRDGIHVRLSTANPRDVVGGAELFAHDYALMCARILNYLQDNIHTAPIVLIPGDNCEGIFDEARRMDATCDLIAKRKSCPNLHNGYCTPINPACPLYKNGKCTNPEEEKK